MKSSARTTRTATATSQIQAELTSLPANVEAWRSWGESVDQVNEG